MYGSVAYVADYAGGLEAIDVSDPSNPTLLGSWNSPGLANSVAVSGGLAFLADDIAGLQVVDVSDPSNPTPIGNYSLSGLAHGVAVTGSRVFLATQLAGLVILDVTDPTQPVLESQYAATSNARGVAVDGAFAFVGDSNAGFQVIRISDPCSPAVAGTYATGTHGYGVAVDGRYCYLAEDTNGLAIFDVSDPSQPALLSTIDTPGIAWKVAASGSEVLVADKSGGLQVIDASDPANAAIVGSYATAKPANDVAVVGSYAFVVADSIGLQVIDLSDPTNPVLVGSGAVSGSVNSVAVAGNYAFVTEYHFGLRIFDISDPTNPVLAASIPTTTNAGDVVVAGDYAFVALGLPGGLDVFSVADPTNPTLAGHLGLSGYTVTLAVAGNYAYLADQDGGLSIVDISDPANPTLQTTFPVIGNQRDVAAQGGFAFLAFSGGNHGLGIVQVSQSEFDSSRNRGQSSSLSDAGGLALRGRLSTAQAGDVSWELSADGGTDFVSVTPGADWTRLTPSGSSLVWRSTHTFATGAGNPTASQVQVDWLTEPALMQSVSDIPNDQGGWVRLSFERSGYDFADEDSLPIATYQIYRRVDDASLRGRIAAEGVIPDGSDPQAGPLASFPSAIRRQLDGHDFLLGGPDLSGALPSGTWEVVGNVSAEQRDDYLIALPTVADSTAQDGITWSVFLVTAHTTIPSIWFASEPDSGYSVDNIAPAMPSGLQVQSPGVLTWDAAPEPDFAYYTIYGAPDSTLTGADQLGYTVDPTFDVTSTTYPYYLVTTSDHAGNEGVPAFVYNPGSSSVDASGQPPAHFVLHTSTPNPFAGGTRIGFALPTAATVRLEIFDVTGRPVRTLGPQKFDAGEHELRWDGLGAKGRPVAQGIYFARLQAGGKERTVKLVKSR